jgi:hypothetical protein
VFDWAVFGPNYDIPPVHPDRGGYSGRFDHSGHPHRVGSIQSLPDDAHGSAGQGGLDLVGLVELVELVEFVE